MSTTTVETATIIKNQIGSRALFMLGAKDLLAFAGTTGPGLSFRIRGSERANGIRVELDLGRDTYVVEFLRLGRVAGRPAKTVSRFDDIYAEDLCQLIGKETGLATSL